MKINKDYESETNLRELFFHILYRWRSILCVALICAVAFGVYQYLSVKTIHDAGKQTKEERQYEMDLVSYQENLQYNQATIKALSKRLQEQTEYRNESIYIQLDAQGAWKATNKYIVTVDQSVMETIPTGIDPADSLLSAYSAPLGNVTDEQLLTDAFGTDKTNYISELVEVETDTYENSVTVYVFGATKEDAQNGMNLVHTQMEKIAAGKAQDVYAHNLTLVSEDVSKSPNKDLQEAQKTLAESMEDNQEILQTARQSLEELMSRPEPTKPGANLKAMAILGFLIGFFLLTAVYVICFLFSGKLRDLSVFTEGYGLAEFGRFEKSSSIHSNHGPDKLIAKWELENKEKNEQTVYQNIVSLIAEQSELHSVLLASTLPEGKLDTLKNVLVSGLPDFTIETQEDFLHNDEAIAKATRADAVIIVEEKEVSRRRDIDRMVNNLMISKANVIGYIAL